MKELWGCTKLNLASFGDANPHLHFHIVPKYEGGFEFGGNFQITNPEPVYLKEEEYEDMIRALLGKIGHVSHACRQERGESLSLDFFPKPVHANFTKCPLSWSGGLC